MIKLNLFLVFSELPGHSPPRLRHATRVGGTDVDDVEEHEEGVEKVPPRNGGNALETGKVKLELLELSKKEVWDTIVF